MITKKLANVVGVASIALTLTSCLKDKSINSLEYGMINYDKQKIAELAAPPNHILVNAMDYVDQVKVLNIATINIAADKPVTEDVTVVTSMADTDAMIAAYNAANGTHVVRLPNSFYNILGSGLSVKVASGERMGHVKAEINAIAFDPSTTYALAFTIQSVDKNGYTISGNFNKVLVLFGAKNKYDGHYDIKFKMLDWASAYGIANTTFEWPSAYGIDLVTTGGNTVKMFSPGHGAYIHVAATTAVPAGLTGFGSTEPKFTFDLSTDKLIGASNDFVGARTFEVNTAYPDSRWDDTGATTKAYLAIIMKQAGRPDLQIFDTLTYVGPRD